MKKYIAVMIIVFFLSSAPFAQQTKNVFIVVIDGARYSETFGDPTHKYIPNIWNELRPKGMIYTSFYNNGQTITNPGHASILTGTWQNVDNWGTQRPNKPTLFEYFRKRKNTSIMDNYVILGKSKLEILSHSTHVEYGEMYRASVSKSSYEYDDHLTFKNVKAVINAHHPKLTIINFSETDEKGHLGVWDKYVDAIQKADNLIFKLWALIQSDPIYRGKTTLFVTNDHGRHTNNFANHGDNCKGCRHIMLLTIGPDTPQGIVDPATRKQIDIAPTIGHLLKIETPYCTGNIINTAFVSEVAK